MLNSLFPPSISSIKIRKRNQFNNIFSPSNFNQSSSTINLINSNQRFNKEEEIKKDLTKKGRSSVKKMSLIKIKLNEKNISKYRSKSELYLPNIYNDDKGKKQNNNKNLVNKKIDNIYRELYVNPVLLKLDDSQSINLSIFKRNSIKSNIFIQRFKNYKKRFKEKSIKNNKINDLSGMSNLDNRTQNYFRDKENNSIINDSVNNTNIYFMNNLKPNVNNELSLLYKKILNYKHIFNNSRKFQFNDECKNSKYFY